MNNDTAMEVRHDSSPNLPLIAYFVTTAALWAFYLYMTFGAPLSQVSVERYGLTPMSAFWLRLSIAAPILVYWSLGLYAAIHLNAYVRKIGPGEGSAPVRSLARGVFIIVMGVILGAAVGSIRQYFPLTEPGNEGIIKLLVILGNYISVGFPLAAFVFIWRGTKSFMTNELAQAKDIVRKYTPVFLFASAVISASYIFLALANPNRQMNLVPSMPATYYLPDWLIVASILLPYVVIWTLGLLSAFNIVVYSQKVSGLIYRKFLNNLVYGILMIIVFYIFLQFLSTIGYYLQDFFKEKGLAPVLYFIYFILFLQALGFIFLARGAKKLKEIETTL
ncbi:MAG: hypothetical protein A3B23_02945 [Candidatus Colwellbacteria bacterium RIFCSPLOWO2_01_FULL_48_10]|uniref:DUF5671 domain-containing protein n=1 Tax=Candidatus Colwellbacteria bacterium RIFCSPLOWO2_01_FULL_48_10 TaxID=1797690 RepID=A0A1G1Z5T9_9BACT|nr:MAG: hypothetical protein A3B23_02945 [Candidatus Colwellbacteria bacterium RIFCSPLOWO2_01_FULL_48_10]